VTTTWKEKKNSKRFQVETQQRKEEMKVKEIQLKDDEYNILALYFSSRLLLCPICGKCGGG
jgi:hypothetical protein